MEYEVQRSTRHCAATGRELLPGEPFYSTLTVKAGNLVRSDFAAEAWQGPPEGIVGWWKAQMPLPAARKARLAPNEVILQLFDQLADQPERADMRYVLALLLVRRRVARAEESELDEEGREVMVMYCPRRETTLRATVVMPSDERAEQIQQELAALLYAETDR